MLPGLFAQVAGEVATQQPVISQDVGWGMIALTALTLAKAIASEVIGYFKNRDDKANDKDVALLKQEHAQCKAETAELKTIVAELKQEVGLLRAEIMTRPQAKAKTT